ncbi:signal transduction histidine kinase [Amycolatopsis cihanbeyliensis]|uniref:histidine kinase n=1 Tax=Amycolatopsis cihanbeyliensis TaxID=1128664 RepID=A0A542DBR9_AMYCI|nr:signal transduction histidine kinase [Amycolatopsis cihanbeyliensis]
MPAWCVDAGVGTVLGGGIVAVGLTASEPPVWVVLAAALAAASSAGRRLLPLPALAGACVAGVLLLPVDRVSELGAVAVGFTGYLVGTARDRVAAAVTALVATATLSFGTLFVQQVLDLPTPGGPELLIAALLTSLALGYAVRSRRELERTLWERARRRTVEERLHIAREVHDVVGHHIAVINVQSGAAAHHLRARPDAAEEALRHVRDAARTVLHELTTVVGVLRENGSEAPAEPQPGLAELDRLVEDLAKAGTRVEWTVAGQPRELSPAVELSAYRIVQESLTNAGKHGRGPVRLRIGYAEDELRIEVHNALRPEGGRWSGQGHGLAGMSERAAALGGNLSAGPRSGDEFVVLARLPAAGREDT